MPVQVADITDATAINAGSFHSCALHQDNTVSCWGAKSSGRLGGGTGNSSRVPVRVASITDATAISAGGQHSCALHRTGTISCWGNNNYGQLGDGTGNNDSWRPVLVAGITDATAITAGDYHSCALHQNGTISCWGYNRYGSLGDGTASTSSVPVQVTGITDATSITTSRYHSCALHQTGNISCWGYNGLGDLGNGTYNDSSVPVRVVGITDATAITAGAVGRHSCALHQGGTISCWGWNDDGQLGNVTYTDSSVPVRVFSITDATAITASRHHSCALHRDGAISCWGRNWAGQLGNGQSGRNARSPAPVRVTGFGG